MNEEPQNKDPVTLPCCGYANPEAVKWNPFNQVVQCHNCGEVYKPIQQDPVAMRYDYDGYGWKYIDSGSGSDWQTRIEVAEPLYTIKGINDGR